MNESDTREGNVIIADTVDKQTLISKGGKPQVFRLVKGLEEAGMHAGQLTIVEESVGGDGKPIFSEHGGDPFKKKRDAWRWLKNQGYQSEGS